MNQQKENELFERVKTGDIAAFEALFHIYYGNLCLYASKILGNNDNTAEEIVQDFFVKLWEKRTEIHIKTSVKNYCLRSVKNYCINHIQHNRIKLKHTQNFISENQNIQDSDNYFIEPNLADKIEECINSLPEKRQEIFRLSREDGLKYREIAQKLKISVKTVETQMSLAIKTLKLNLKNYYTLLFFF